MKYATVRDSGDGIRIAFDHSTTQNVNCAALFTSVTLGTLGKSPMCLWTTPSELLILFGINPTVLIGDTLTLLSDLATNITLFTNRQVKVQAPVNATVPMPVIASPSTVGLCTAWSLDGTNSAGNGGRPFTSWTWSTTTAINAAVTKINSMANGNVIQWNARELSAGSYSFTLTVKNWLLQTASTTVQVSVSDAAIPSVRIQGGSSVQSIGSRDVALSAVAFAGCDSSRTPSLVWTITPSIAFTTTMTSTSTQSTFIVSGSSLAIGTLYTATVTATDTSNQQINTASVTVQRASQGLRAQIVGGNGTHPAGTAIPLDASPSRDLDDSNASLTYSWNCINTDTNTSCVSMINNTNSAVTFATKLALGNYLFTATVSRLAKTTVTAAMTAQVVAGNPPVISVTSNSANPVRLDRKLYLTATVDTDLSSTVFQWSITGGSLASSNLQDNLLSDLNSPVLVLKKNALLPSSTYTFTVSATANGATGMTSVQVTTAAPPCCGTLTVQPGDNGTYVLIAQNYVSSTPGSLSYAFLLQQSDAPALPLSDISMSNQRSTRLPTGNLILQVVVYDMYGNSYQTSIDYQVQEQEDTLTGLEILEGFIQDIEAGSADLGDLSPLIATILATSTGQDGLVVRRKMIRLVSDHIGDRPLTQMEIIRDMGFVDACLDPATFQSKRDTTINMILGVDALQNVLSIMQQIQAGVEAADLQFTDNEVINGLMSISGHVTAQISQTSASSNLTQIATNIKTFINQFIASITASMAPGEDPVIYQDDQIQVIVQRVSTSQLEGNISMSADGETGAQFPANVVNGSQYDSVGINLVKTASNPYASSSLIQVASAVVVITILDSDGNEIVIQDLQDDIVITVPLTGGSENGTAQCLYWDDDMLRWSDYGCHVIDVVDDLVFCGCNHLTEFALASTDFTLATNHPPPPAALASSALPGVILFGSIAAGVLIFVIGMLGTAVIVYRHRRRSSKRGLLVLPAPDAKITDSGLDVIPRSRSSVALNVDLEGETEGPPPDYHSDSRRASMHSNSSRSSSSSSSSTRKLIKHPMDLPNSIADASDFQNQEDSRFGYVEEGEASMTHLSPEEIAALKERTRIALEMPTVN
eukprot:TRINITY_DN2498_c0_g1_i5.p1 TRINITY_DN2498_c0_g1~~TRINITY_DN2498_c0_g1_i5.p1  ORF type:complete len:1237 (-),score=283.41 TRINITY_DN2498_c0_g1_i5:17-3322(-)